MLYELTIAIVSVAFSFLLYFSFRKFFQTIFYQCDEIKFDERHDLIGKELIFVSVVRMANHTFSFIMFSFGWITVCELFDLFKTKWFYRKYGRNKFLCLYFGISQIISTIMNTHTHAQKKLIESWIKHIF